MSKHRKSNKTAYAVRVGRNPGIYNSWDEAKKEVHKFKGAEYKGFCSHEDAVKYMGKLAKPKKLRKEREGRERPPENPDRWESVVVARLRQEN